MGVILCRLSNLACMVGLISLVLATACTTYTTQADNTPGRASIYRSPSTPGPIQGIGVESQDIISMCDRMVHDILANPFWSAGLSAPRIIVDSRYFMNESPNVVNTNTITDRLRVQLNRSAQGRLVFIGRHYSNMVEHERALKRQGIVSTGSKANTPRPMGGDYRLGGRISSLDKFSPGLGSRARFTQVVFEIVDLNTSAIVWSGMYDYRKTSKNNVIYRRR